MSLPRAQAKLLCGKPYALPREPGDEEQAFLYCALWAAHGAPHIALLWWFDDDPVTAPGTPAPGR